MGGSSSGFGIGRVISCFGSDNEFVESLIEDPIKYQFTILLVTDKGIGIQSCFFMIEGITFIKELIRIK